MEKPSAVAGGFFVVNRGEYRTKDFVKVGASRRTQSFYFKMCMRLKFSVGHNCNIFKCGQ